MSYKLARELVKEEAIDLGIGESRRVVCPKCNASHETSCSITKEELGILYNCYRAKCDFEGFIPSVSVGTPRVKKKEFTPKIVDFDLVPLPEDIREFLKGSYYMDDYMIDTNGFKYAPEKERLMMPLFNKFGFQFGYVGKYLGENEWMMKNLKGISYFENDGAKLHYPITAISSGPIVIVEDILSSVRVAQFARTIALLGHNISDIQIQEIAQQTKDVILALDPDVVQKALSYRRKFGFSFRNFSVKILSKDPKDMTDEQILEEILS